jgi:phosphoribosylanthranilate isomerase
MTMVETPARPAGAGSGEGEQPVPARTVVKVCGITNLEDARAAIADGADWLGFVFHAPSPRHVDPARAADIIAALPGVTAVAVMVATPAEQALALARRIGAVRVQMHRPSAGWPPDFPLPVTLVVPVAADGTLAAPLPDPRHLVMLDTAHAELAGGTGETFPWRAAQRVARERPVMLAGGLAPLNVREAVLRVQPYGVDASSGLERAPGLKDHALVRRFIERVRAADRAKERT